MCFFFLFRDNGLGIYVRSQYKNRHHISPFHNCDSDPQWIELCGVKHQTTIVMKCSDSQYAVLTLCTFTHKMTLKSV